jgi:hypothetical protein
LVNIIIETNKYARHKIAELQLSPRSIWSRWSDMSVPEVKAFLDLIINMGLILVPLPNLKDYWSSDKKTQIKFFGDNVQTSLFTDISDDACGEMVPPKKAIGPSKKRRKYMG